MTCEYQMDVRWTLKRLTADVVMFILWDVKILLQKKKDERNDG